jgi:hypothetical protein
MVLGLAVVLAVLPGYVALAGEAQGKAEAPGEPKAAPASAEKPAGLVGTIVAVVPASRTLVVDVPLGKEVLRIGAEVTDKTKITAAGKAVSLDRVNVGDRVRISFRRIEAGDEAISIEVLRGTKS